jgi:hypothetical protein
VTICLNACEVRTEGIKQGSEIWRSGRKEIMQRKRQWKGNKGVTDECLIYRPMIYHDAKLCEWVTAS